MAVNSTSLMPWVIEFVPKILGSLPLIGNKLPRHNMADFWSHKQYKMSDGHFITPDLSSDPCQSQQMKEQFNLLYSKLILNM